MHLVQRAGLPGDCLYPACLSIRPPSPANGAAHSLQRGGDGIRRNNRRRLARPGLSPVSTARTFSGVNPSAAICSIYLPSVPMSASILTAALDQPRGASTAEPRRPGSDQARAQTQIKAARSQPAEPCERSANDHHPRFTTQWSSVASTINGPATTCAIPHHQWNRTNRPASFAQSPQR